MSMGHTKEMYELRLHRLQTNQKDNYGVRRKLERQIRNCKKGE